MSEKRAIGLMGCRTNGTSGLSEQRAVPHTQRYDKKLEGPVNSTMQYRAMENRQQFGLECTKSQSATPVCSVGNRIT